MEASWNPAFRPDSHSGQPIISGASEQVNPTGVELQHGREDPASLAASQERKINRFTDTGDQFDFHQELIQSSNEGESRAERVAESHEPNARHDGLFSPLQTPITEARYQAQAPDFGSVPRDSSEKDQLPSVAQLPKPLQEKSQDTLSNLRREEGADSTMNAAFATEVSSHLEDLPGTQEVDNSFPDVLPPETMTVSNQPVLPRSQAEEILQGDQSATQDLPSAALLSIQNDWSEGNHSFENEVMGSEVPPQIDQIHPTESTIPLVADVKSVSDDVLAAESSPFSFDVGEDDDYADGDAFFANLQSAGGETKRELSPGKGDVEASPSARGSLLDDKFNVRSVLSKVSDTNSQDQSSVFEDKPSSQNQDLSDLWKAALGDDDLSDDGDAVWDPSALTNDYPNGSSTKTATSPPSLLQHQGDTSKGSSLSQDRVAQNRDRVQPANSDQKAANRYTPAARANHGRGRSFGDPPPSSQTISALPNASSTRNGYPNHTPSSQTFADILGPARPKLRDSGNSFVDKSREGYKSPYDLPMDVSRPRKRPSPAIVRSNTATPLVDGRPPPPRRDSIMSSHQPVQMPNAAESSFEPTERSSTGLQARAPHQTGFFEELPASKPRPSSSIGRSSAPITQPLVPPKSSFVPSPTQLTPEILDNNSALATYQNQLVPAQKLSLYETAASQPPARNTVPGFNSRYSPAPSQASSNAPPATRYSVNAANVTRPQSTRTLPHQPRTSSPLTQRSASVLQQSFPSNFPQEKGPVLPTEAQVNANHLQPSVSSAQTSWDSLVVARENSFVASETLTGSPPLLHAQDIASRAVSSEPGYSLQETTPVESMNGMPVPVKDGSRNIPPRSLTQSPNARVLPSVGVAGVDARQRPQSVQSSRPSQYTGQYASRQTTESRTRTERDLDVNYLRPNDGRELDPFERWKGCPIFSFGFGGKAVKMFPQRVPRYVAGQKVPLMKCSPGEVRMEDNHFAELDDSIATFPGPLKAKGKKKEVLDWLNKRLENMASSDGHRLGQSTTLSILDRRQKERFLLWKILGVLVENDGNLAGNPTAEKAVRIILSPSSTDSEQAGNIPHPQGVQPSTITKTKDVSSVPSVESPLLLEHIKTQLLQGERERAVWHAVDNKLWAHAMLISSTLGGEIKKQVAQEFVRQEVKPYGTNTESLAALYQVFAGNWEESVDELVPPSARAGLQMMSINSNKGPAKNALDGLDRWRDTLALILSNRTTDDSKALVALGRLLASYGRTEASHICYIFAQTPALFGAPDDPQVSIALLGADHVGRPYDYGRDFDSILLTEVYDFARTILSASSAVTISPHLQSYRLHHAMILAEHGHKAEATKYCEAVSATLKATTKPSPYYHALLLGSLQGLQDRLRQTPHESTGSWISKPSIDKVSGSIWAKFNSYVAGDEDDATTNSRNTSYDPAAGPFAGIAGDSALSRTASSTDLAMSYEPTYGYHPNLAPNPSPYAPASGYTPRTSLDQQRQPTSMIQSSDPNNLRLYLPAQRNSSRPTTSAGTNPQSYTSRPSYAPRAQSYQPLIAQGTKASIEQNSEAPTNRYGPTHLQATNGGEVPAEVSSHPLSQEYQPPSEVTRSPYEPSQQNTIEAHLTQPETDEESTPQYPGDPSSDSTSLYSQQATPLRPSSYEPPVSSYEPPISSYEPLSSSYEQSASSYEPPTSSYEPPSSFSYEPPTQSFYPSEPETNAEVQKPKKSIMDLDDEDDFEARAAALRKEEKARKDRETDEAFRKAAEADAQKDKAPGLNSKKSWFGGGWFGAGKDKAKEAGPPGAPIKVKLGEENSFYFDKELGKWINKKGGTEETVAAPAAPPPKGPSRAVSAAAGPPARLMSTPPVPPIPAGVNSSGPPMRAVSGPALTKSTGVSNPSRTSSPVKQANEVNSEGGELLQPPSAPPSRPATSQGGTTTDVDDLYGPPQARKGGTVRKGKKRAGYVDVMAK